MKTHGHRPLTFGGYKRPDFSPRSEVTILSPRFDSDGQGSLFIPEGRVVERPPFPCGRTSKPWQIKRGGAPLAVPKIALAHMDVKAGMPERNWNEMRRMVRAAAEDGCDLIAFSEMAVGGYYLGDRYRDDYEVRDLMKYDEKLLALSAEVGIAIVWGNVYLDEGLESRMPGPRGKHTGKDGGIRRYNAARVAQDGKWVRRAKETNVLPPGVHPKTLLPNYGIFDDQRWFFSMRDIADDFGVPVEDLEQPFMVKVRKKDGRGGRDEVPIGFPICEDGIWAEDYQRNLKTLNTSKMMIDNGARYILSINASPWNPGKAMVRDERVKFLKREAGDAFVPYLYLNHGGVMNNGKNFISFDASANVYDKNGDLITMTEDRPGLTMIEQFDTPPIAREARSPIAEKWDATLKAIRHVADVTSGGKPMKWLVGLSGGIDSALSAMLLVEAVGPENVVAINMPSKYNKSFTIGTAERIAANLGIKYATAPIQSLVDELTSVLSKLNDDEPPSSLTEENLQAKIRATDILSNLAGMHGALFSNNGNKLEIELGYGTLYGDWGGALAILGDLLKVEVWELARLGNQKAGREVIPEDLLPDEEFQFRKKEARPSAELKDEQVDPMKWGYHDAISAVLTDSRLETPDVIAEWFVEGTLHRRLAEKLSERGIDVTPDRMLAIMERWEVVRPSEFLKDLDWYFKTRNKAVFKRVQSPPTPITSKFAYGYDRRESILPYHETLDYREGGPLRTRVQAAEIYRPAS